MIHKLSLSKKDLVSFGAFLFVFCVYCILSFGLPILAPNLALNCTQRIKFVIPAGTSAADAARIIEMSGAAGDARALIRAFVFYKIDRSIKPGIYSVYKGSAYGIARQMKETDPEQTKIILIPGARYKQLASQVDNISGAGAFDKAMADDSNFPKEIKHLLPEDTKTRMALLHPETYFIPPCESAAGNFVRTASSLWYKKTGAEVLKQCSTPKLLHDTAVLASLVECEARFASEHKIIAGVFKNRISLNMRLQCDATVTYVYEERDGKRKKNITYEDLKIASPYNTYVNYGLPPAAISCPSHSAWLGAAYPEKTEFLYFFAKEDGHHEFTKNYKEHIAHQKGIKEQ